MNRSKTQQGLAYVGVLVIATSFIGLGIWQWNRAQESRIPVVVDSTLVSLQSITHPRIALPSDATLRHVQVTGRYIADFQAPDQVDGSGRTNMWEVGLLATDSGAAVLVVRGLWSQRHQETESSSVTVTGKLMPHQSDDHAEPAKGVLSRLDSSVVVDQTSLDLYDGYVIADSESVGGARITREWINPPVPRSAVPGFYWQHVSYVVIWWFMAGVVLYLPFYQRRVTPEQINESESE